MILVVSYKVGCSVTVFPNTVLFNAKNISPFTDPWF